MKNIQIIDGAQNCTYDIFAVSDADFKRMFPDNNDVAFIDELVTRISDKAADAILIKMWKHRVEKKAVRGIHGTLFYELPTKKKFYPTRKESEMVTGF